MSSPALTKPFRRLNAFLTTAAAQPRILCTAADKNRDFVSRFAIEAGGRASGLSAASFTMALANIPASGRLHALKV